MTPYSLLGADAVKVQLAATPSFNVRRWSLTHLQGPFESCAEYDNWVVLQQNTAGPIRRYINLARQFGINSIELTGRPGEGGIDLDWLTTYQQFPKFRRTGEVGAHIRRRQEIIQLINDWCEAESLELWIWHHEFHVPRDFYEAYPEIRGVDYPVCLSHPLIPEIIAGKIEEFLNAVPNITGLVLSMNECSGVEVLAPESCRCVRCRAMSVPQRLRMMVDYVREPLQRYGKKLVARTFTAAHYREVLKHTESEHVFEAFQDLPDDVILMSKYCPLDFYGEEYPDDPLIGAFNNPHLVEFTLNREIMGGTYTPNLTPVGIKNRFMNAAAKHCIGVVGRVDSPTHSDDPYLTIDHPNAFNIYCFGQLAQDVSTSIDELWDSYLTQRYPRSDRATLRRVLEPTEAIGQKTYMTLGTYALSYAHRIPHIWQAEERFELLTLAKFREDWLDNHNRIQEHDPTILEPILKEKEEAAQLSLHSLELLPHLKGQLSPLEYLQLELGLLRSSQAAQLWRYLSEIYFVAHCISAGTLGNYERLLDASLKLFDLTRTIRRDFGLNAWPTVAGPYRGIGCEEFVAEVYHPLIYDFLHQPMPARYSTQNAAQVTEYFYPRDNVEHLWRVLLALDDPDAYSTGSFVNVDIESLLSRVDIQRQQVVMHSVDGRSLTLPLYYSVDEATLESGQHRVHIGLPGWGGRHIRLSLEKNPAV